MRWHIAQSAAAISLLALAVSLGACGTSSTAADLEHPLLAQDANGFQISIPAQAPQRIISLGPVTSEMLGALKVDSRVIAVDTFTDYPSDLTSKPKVTDANGQPNVEQIIALKPDLVLSYGGDTSKADHQLEQAHLNVVDLPAKDLSGSLQEIRLVGQLVHEQTTANTLVDSLQQRIDAVQAKVKGQPPVSVYMELDHSTPGKPYAFGAGSFGDEMIRDAGGSNIFGSDTSGAGYPQVSDEAIIAANPQIIVLTEDPKYGGDPSQVASRPGWSVIAAVKDGRVYQMNPDLFQRPGPRIVDGLEQLAKVLHPNQFK